MLGSDPPLRGLIDGYEAALNSFGGIVFSWDEPSDSLTWGGAMVSILGYRSEEMPRTWRDFLDRIHPEDVPRVERVWSEARRANADFRLEFRLRRRGGIFLSVILEARPGLEAERRRWNGFLSSAERLRRFDDSQYPTAEQLRMVVDSLPGLVSYVDASRCYRFVNAEYARWFNQPTSYFLGKRFDETLTAEQIRERTPYLEMVMAGRAVSFEIDTQHVSKGLRNTLVTYVPDRDAEGKVRGFVVLVQDITEMTQSREAERAAHRNVIDTLESMTDGFVSFGSEYRVTYANYLTEALLGLKRDQIVGRPVKEVFRSPDRRKFERRYRRVVATGKPDRFVDTYQGRVLRVNAYRGQDGGVSCFYRDVTDERRAQEALQSSHEQLVGVLEGMGDAFVALDRDFHIVRVNANFERLTRTRREDILRRSLWEVFPESEKGHSSCWVEYHRVMQQRVHSYFEDHDPLQDTWNAVDAYPTADGGMVAFFRDISLQKKGREAIERSENQFRTLVDSAPVMLWLTGRDGTTSYMSDQWYRYTGPGENDLGFGWLNKVHPDDQARSRETFHEAFRARRPFELDYRLRHKDGSYRWAIDMGNPRFDPKGNFLGYVGTVVDVHDRKCAEQEASASRASLDLSLNASRLGVFDWDIAEGTTQWSERTEELFGYSPGTFSSRYEDFLSRVHPDDQAQVVLDTRSAIEHRTDYSGEFRVLLPGGRIRWISSRGRCSYSAVDGRPLRMSGVVMDITDRKADEMAHEDQRLWLEAVLNTTPIPTVLVEPGTARILFANRAVYLMEGGRLVESIVSHRASTIPPCTDVTGQPLRPDEMPAQRAARGEKIDGYQLNWHLPDRVIPLILYSETLPAMYGHPATVVLSFHDITVLKQAESELQKAIRIRDDFLSIASHELKTPLTSLKLQLQMVMRLLRPDSSHRFTSERLLKMLGICDRQMRNLGVLIDDLLDVSRIANGRLSIDAEDTDLGKLVHEVVERFSEAGTCGPAIEVSAPLGVIGCWDRHRIEQVVVNLISNAIKYGEGKLVEVDVEGAEDKVRLLVRDRGMGIAREHHHKIFDRFERAVSARSISGLGLGLYICREIVLAHQGKIDVESELGAGATFCVELPVRVDA